MRILLCALSMSGLVGLSGCAVPAASDSEATATESAALRATALTATATATTTGTTTTGSTTLSATALVKTATTGGISQTVNGGVVYFKCGYNPKTYRSECSCSGDADCNNMFESGFCASDASCDTGNNTCTCELAW